RFPLGLFLTCEAGPAKGPILFVVVMFAVIAGFAFAAITFCAIHAAVQRKFSPFGWYALMSLGVFLIAGTLAIRVGLPDPEVHNGLRRISLLGCIPYLAGMLYIYHDRLGSR